jgi:hypothetical protein
MSFNISHVEICLGLKLTIKTEYVPSYNNVMCDVLFTLINHVNFRESCTLSNQKLVKILLTLHTFSMKFKVPYFLGNYLVYPEIKSVNTQLTDVSCSIPVYFMHRQ